MLIVSRSHKNPLLVPVRERQWEALATFNPSVVLDGDTAHMFYRAIARPDVLLAPHAGASSIGYAKKVGSGTFASRTQVIAPEEAWEAYGCEDPRATFFEGKWYVLYTALGGYPFGPDNIKMAIACGDSPLTLTEKHLITPFNAKAGVLFPERINGEVVMLLTCHTDYTQDHPRPTIAVARAKNIEDFFNASFWHPFHEHLPDHALENLRRGDDDHVEIGAAPIKTEKGWLLIYSHIKHYYNESQRLFGIEACLLDLNNPQKVIGRTEFPLLVPETSYEEYGIVPRVTFPSSTTVSGDRLDIYYGAADTVCAVAHTSLSDLLFSMDAKNRTSFMKRHEKNPILTARKEYAWESRSVSNAAAFDADGSVHLLYRAMGNENTSVMGYARLKDGLHVDERSEEPVYVPREEFEMKKGKPDGNSGCEDPRIVEIDKTIYMCYTAYDGVNATRGALTTIPLSDFLSKNWDAWTKPLLLTPPQVNDKDICIFPERASGKAVVMHRIDPNICVDLFDTFSFERPINRCIEIMAPRRGTWEEKKIGAAGPPLKVSGGWLFVYHAVGEDGVYRLGAALLDEAGTTVLSRTVFPILEPSEVWEKEGMVNNVVFSCGMVLRDDTLFVYYGGADTVIGVATISFSLLMSILKPSWLNEITA